MQQDGKPWPADKVERWPTERLVNFARNSRSHTQEQIEKIASSIREWGFTSPVLVQEDGTIIAGHARTAAARKLGLSEVPVMVARGWTDAQIRAYVIADNQLAISGAGWDDEMLALELGELNAEGFDLDLVGFNEEELNKLLGSAGGEGLTDPDDIPEPPVHPVSVLGDVWIMGRHRIVAGDSTDPLVIEKALNGVKPHLMCTDPPYGVDYDPSWRSKALKDGAKRAEGIVSNDGQSDWREAWSLFPGDVTYVWHGMLHAGTVFQSLVDAGFEIRAEIVWAKTRHVLSRGHYHPQHESAFYAVRKGSTAHWAGDRKQTTLWTIEHTKSDTGHGTQKPVECFKRPIENNSSPGHAIYEPFSGSGTCLMACEITGRCAHAVELNPQYVDVAVKRWMQHVGQEAILESTGQTFSEVSAARPTSGTDAPDEPLTPRTDA